jgi:hypothetical protein
VAHDLPLARKVQTLRAVIPEWHTDTRNGVEDLEATDWLSWVTGIP